MDVLNTNKFCGPEPLSLNKTSMICFLIEPPVFMRPFESAELVKGSDIVLEGTISGSAPFEISCFLNDALIRNDKRHKVSIENDTVTVDISNCVSGDAGTYRCTVTNDVGETSCSCQISLKGLLKSSQLYLPVQVLH